MVAASRLETCPPDPSYGQPEGPDKPQPTSAGDFQHRSWPHLFHRKYSTSAATVNGLSVDIKVADGKVHVGGATVVTADIICDNGVIHVIDTVLMPK